MRVRYTSSPPVKDQKNSERKKPQGNKRRTAFHLAIALSENTFFELYDHGDPSYRRSTGWSPYGCSVSNMSLSSRNRCCNVEDSHSVVSFAIGPCFFRRACWLKKTRRSDSRVSFRFVGRNDLFLFGSNDNALRSRDWIKTLMMSAFVL